MPTNIQWFDCVSVFWICSQAHRRRFDDASGNGGGGTFSRNSALYSCGGCVQYLRRTCEPGNDLWGIDWRAHHPCKSHFLLDFPDAWRHGCLWDPQVLYQRHGKLFLDSLIAFLLPLTGNWQILLPWMLSIRVFSLSSGVGVGNGLVL